MQLFPSVLISLASPGELTSWGTMHNDDEDLEWAIRSKNYSILLNLNYLHYSFLLRSASPHQAKEWKRHCKRNLKESFTTWSCNMLGFLKKKNHRIIESK